MPLFIQDRDSLLVVATTAKTNDITNWFIGLEECAVFRYSTFVIESLCCLCIGPVVIDVQRQTRNQVRSLTSARINFLEIEFGVLQKDLFIAPPLSAISRYLVWNLANNAQTRCRFKGRSRPFAVKDARDAPLEGHPINLPITINFDIKT